MTARRSLRRDAPRRSGADGSALWTWYGDQIYATLGLGDPIGDLDSDGFEDVLASEPYYAAGTLQHAGRVFVFREGRLGRCSRSTDDAAQSRRSPRRHGRRRRRRGAGLRRRRQQQTEVTLISGATGTTIRTLKSPRNGGDSFVARSPTSATSTATSSTTCS
jgi:hypothetical protein